MKPNYLSHTTKSIIIQRRMKKRFSILILLIGLLSSSIETKAELLGQDMATDKAMEFFGTPGPHRVKGADDQPSQVELSYIGKDNGNEYLYVFNNAGGGFVIVSASSKSANAVLGYSLTGRFDYSILPENARNFIDGYVSDLIELEKSVKVPRKNALLRSESPEFTNISPLLQDNHWGQGHPFNKLCPVIDGVVPPVGCTATSMGQVMWFHQWPKTGQGYASYIWNGSLLSANLNESKYDWDAIKPSYLNPDLYDENSENAVALLMRDIAYSLHTNFTPYASGSGEAEARNALRANFDYRCLLFNAEWYERNTSDRLVYDELRQGRPVLCYGSNSSGGHAYVCDGCDSNGYFHYNWGWSGASDGYFLSSASLYPHYSVMLDIEPKNDSAGRDLFTLYGGGPITYERSGVVWYITYVCSSRDDMNYETALAMKNEATGDIHYQISGQAKDDPQFESYCTLDASGLDDGTYIIYPVARHVSENEWHEYVSDENSETGFILTVKNESFVMPENETWTENGISYEEFEDGVVRITDYMPDESGTLNLQSNVIHNGKKYWVWGRVYIEDNPDVINIISDLRMLHIYNCPNLESVSLLNNWIYGDIVRCPKLETLKIPDDIINYELNVWDTDIHRIDIFGIDGGSLVINPSCLSADIDYYLHTLIPPTLYEENERYEMQQVSRPVIHVTEGYTDVYAANGFSDYNIIDDIPDSKSISVDWSYCPGMQTINEGLGHTHVGHVFEVALKIKAEELKPYIGQRIKGFKWHCSTSGSDVSVDYIFISQGGDYKVKTPVTADENDCWYDFKFDKEFVIDGNELYVGIGGLRNGWGLTYATKKYEIEQNAYYREVGNSEWTLIKNPCNIEDWPLAMSITIGGDNLPVDAVIQWVEASGNSKTVSGRKVAVVDGESSHVTMWVQNRSTERVSSLTVDLQINGKEYGEIQVPCAIAPNQSSFVGFDFSMSGMPSDMEVAINISKVNSLNDDVKNQTIFKLLNTNNFTHYPRLNIIESTFHPSGDEGADALIAKDKFNAELRTDAIWTSAIWNFTGGSYCWDFMNYSVDKLHKSRLPHNEYDVSVNRKYIQYCKQECIDYKSLLNGMTESYASIDNLEASIDGGKNIFLSSKVRFGGDVDGDDFKTVFILTEKQAGPFAIRNYYHDSETPHYGWESLGWEADVTIDDFVLMAYPSFAGATLLHGELLGDVPYEINHQFLANVEIRNPDNLDLIMLIIDSNGEIVNARKSAVTKHSIVEHVVDNELTIQVINGTVTCLGGEVLSIYTVDGRPVAADNLPTGIYIVTAVKDGEIIVKKIVI